MKAIIQTRHGGPEVLEIADVAQPVPKANEILVRVHAATVTAGDVIMRKMHPLLFVPLRLFGARRKPIPGHEFSGVVEAVGSAVTRFKPGDAVLGTTTGLTAGTFAEYLCVPESWSTGVLAHKPEALPFDEAAALPIGGMTALYLLEKAHIQPGQKVLVYGASGSVGTFAVQLAAHHYGAAVTGVCSARNAGLVKSIGAAQVLDYRNEAYLQDSQVYDVILDAVGKISAAQVKPLLAAKGVYLSVRTPTKEVQSHLETLAALAGDRKIRSVIEQHYPLEQAAEAHRHVDSRRKVGNVVVVPAGYSDK